MRKCALLAMCVGVLVLSGCSQESPESTRQHGSNTDANIDGSKFLLDAEPEGATNVIAVRGSAKNDDEIVMVGRIGGGVNPWIEGRAAFSVVDESLRACSDIEGDSCNTPWDYCCETHKLPGATALVKIVDENGQIVKSDARQLLNVKELSTVIVKGKAERDEEGNLNVLASSVYVKQK